MKVKKELAKRITEDFHGEAAAVQAAEDWEKQFQKSEVPEDVETVSILTVGVDPREIKGLERYWPYPDKESVLGIEGRKAGWLRMDKLLVESHLANSRTEAARKIKEGAVKVQNKVFPPETTSLVLQLPAELVISLGKKIRRVTITTYDHNA
jgi:tyrosyl-tRNA synthetase